MIRTVTVNTSKQSESCPIVIGRDLVRTLPEILTIERHSKVVAIVDSGAAHIGLQVKDALKLPAEQILTLTGGELCKTVSYVDQLWQFFAAQLLDRRSLVICIGGGAVSDLVGFASATYMRGISYAAIPTTLLAQVDASIGGKTGFNFAGVKNLIGIVRQPRAIIVDIDTLQGLPNRDLCSGFAEVVKHGAIADLDYFTLVTSRPCEKWSPDELVAIVTSSCEIKARIVEQDETEEGLRKNLNFGHTIGHAVEALSLASESPLTHGEAVSIGMHAAGFISWQVGLLGLPQLQKLVAGLQLVGLPVRLSHKCDASEAVSYTHLTLPTKA